MDYPRLTPFPATMPLPDTVAKSQPGLAATSLYILSGGTITVFAGANEIQIMRAQARASDLIVYGLITYRDTFCDWRTTGSSATFIRLPQTIPNNSGPVQHIMANVIHVSHGIIGCFRPSVFVIFLDDGSCGPLFPQPVPSCLLYRHRHSKDPSPIYSQIHPQSARRYSGIVRRSSYKRHPAVVQE
jgi:hypothetical protein